MHNEPNQPTQKPRSMWRALLPALIVLLLSPLAILYGPVVIDYIKVSQYQLSERVGAIDSRVYFTGTGERVFYATSPQIQDRDQFNTNCQSTERTAAILGCYFKDKIYLYNINNKELDGTLEVTAAHEMLHAAYQRLNMFERGHVEEMVQAEYQKVKDEPGIKQIMQYYKQAEPGEEVNELHSIIGTTVATLSPELEAYYARYFENRAAVVELNTAYNRVFDDLKRQSGVLQDKITKENEALKSDMAIYETDLQQLNIDIESFNARAKSGSFVSPSAFGTARSSLTARVDDLNARRDDLNARVAAYNADVESLNALSVKATKLNESLNGVTAPAGV